MAGLLEHRIPDVVCTADLPVPLAAEVDFLAGRVDRWLHQSLEISAAISARSLAFLGRASEARRVLAGLDAAELGPIDLSAAAWAASRVGGPTLDPLLARFENSADAFITGLVPVGPTTLFSGMLRAAKGDLAGAASDLATAIDIGDARAPLWGALGRLELARVLRTAEAVPLPNFVPATSALTAARTFFAAGGYRSLLDRVAVDASTRATLVVGSTSVVGFGVHPSVEVKSSKGLTALHHLISHRDRIVTAAELAVVVDGGRAAALAALTPAAWHEIADRAAHREFDSPASPDDASVALRRVFFDDATRSRITKLVRRTIDKLREECPPLGWHLDASVGTGHGCRYLPSGLPVEWELLDVAR